jgi:hypothetical protein
VTRRNPVVRSFRVNTRKSATRNLISISCAMQRVYYG